MLYRLLMFSNCMLCASLAWAQQDASPEQSMGAQIAVVERYAEANGLAVPAVKDYEYGMKLDIAQVISTSQAPKVCKSVPVMMTYKDSQGQLNAVRYMVGGICPSDDK